MARTLKFVAEFTKSKVKTTPANAPTIDIADLLDPTGNLLVSGGSPTQLTNLTGVYVYSYSAADGVLPVGVMRTADTTVDLQDVPTYPIAFDANGLVKSSLYAILGTLLTETSGQIAAAFKKFFDKATPTGTINSIPDAVAGATGGIAVVGSNMNLADDAITNAKIAADAIGESELAASAVAEIQSGLSTLTAANVWAYATRTLTTGAVTAASATNTRITQYRGTTWSLSFTNIGALTGYDKLYFTLKRQPKDSDNEALVQIEIAGGLSRLNGAAYTTTSDGSITIQDEPTGDITVTVKPAVTKKLEPATNLFFDVKFIIDGVVSIPAKGTVEIVGDITRAVS